MTAAAPPARRRHRSAPAPATDGMLDSLLAPKSIAVVGASRAPHTIGWQILDNLLRHGYTGAVYPVNPSAR